MAKTFFPNKPILVTGGAGFIGSHLCELLLAEGNEVFCVDNFLTGRRQNIDHLLKYPLFELVRHDITFPLYVEVDQIYNLACPASPIHYQFDPVQTTKTSVVGAVNMRCAETLFFDYHRQHKLAIKVIRIFNTYGPRMNPHDGRVVSNFIMQALQGKQITLYGDGLQTRFFCYVDDLVDGLMRMMATDSGVTGPINLGNPSEFTIRQLAETVKQLTGSKSKIVHKPLPEDDPKHRKPNIAAAKKHLEWNPTVELAEGLGKTIAYFEELLLHSSATYKPA